VENLVKTNDNGWTASGRWGGKVSNLFLGDGVNSKTTENHKKDIDVWRGREEGRIERLSRPRVDGIARPSGPGYSSITPTHFPPHNPLDSPTFPQFRCGGVKYLHLNCALSKIYAHLFVRLQRISSSRSRLKWKSMRRCLHVHGEIITHLNRPFNNHMSHVKSSLNTF